jgi:hypothetical protein
MAESLAVVAGPSIVSDVTDVAGRWKEGLQMSASTTTDSSLDAATSRRRRLGKRALTAVRVLLAIQFAAGGPITGRWEQSADGADWKHDFDLRYQRIS